MAERVSVAETARANVRSFQAAAATADDGNGRTTATEDDGAHEARALVCLDRAQRADRIDERLATDDENALLMLFR